MRSSLGARAAALCGLLALPAACAKTPAASVPDLEDAPKTGRVLRKDVPELIPAYGIASEGPVPQFIVNIEAEDSPRVRPGQRAVVSVTASSATVRCRVARLLRGASAETNQALAWLEPESPSPVAANDFVSAMLEVGTRRRALTVPREAVMIRDGRTTVLRVARSPGGKTAYEPAPVRTGAAAGDEVEILSGLKEGDAIVVSGGLGLLFPEFKAAAED